MRAPMIPGKRPEDADQREAMLRRLGIAEEKPRTPSRWDVLARDLDPAPPVQTPPPPAQAEAAPPALRDDQPIPVAEMLRVHEPPAPAPEPVAVQPQPVPAAPEPVVEAPVAFQPQPVAAAPEPVIEAPVARRPEPGPMESASFMPGWGEESIPEEEDEEAEAFEEAQVEAQAAPPPQSRWVKEPAPSAEAPRREELPPQVERPVSYAAPQADRVANDEDLAVPPPPIAEPVPEPVVEAPVFRAPEPVVVREPAPEPVAPPPVVETPAPVEPPVLRQPEPAPQSAPEPPVVQPVVEAPVARQPEPAPPPAAPPLDAALQEMRAELAAMRKQFQTAPAAPVAEAPIAAAVSYERRGSKQTDAFANARMVIWTLAIVAALWVTYHALQASAHHAARQDHIMATVTGKDTADDSSSGKADQNSDN